MKKHFRSSSSTIVKLMTAAFGPSVLFAVLLLLAPMQVSAQAVSDSELVNNPDSLVASAMELIYTGRQTASDSALVLFHQALEIEPQHVEALKGLVIAHLERVAKCPWLSQIGSSPDQPLEIAASCAYLYLPLNPVRTYGPPDSSFASAWAAVERLRTLSPVTYWYLRGQIAARGGSHRLALEEWEKALSYDPDNELVLRVLENRYFGLGRHHHAVATGLHLLEVDPDAYWPWVLLGYEYFHTGLPEKAQTAFEQALLMRPEETNAIFGVMLSRIAAGDAEGAIAFADSVWRSRPDTSLNRSLELLGEAHFLAGNFTEAEHYFDAALAQDSTSFNQYTVRSTTLPLAAIYAQTGRRSEIQPMIERAYAWADERHSTLQEPWNEYLKYAGSAVIQGDHERALRWLRTAHEAGMPSEVLLLRDPVFRPLHGNPEFKRIVSLLQRRGVEIRRRIREAEEAAVRQ